MDMIWYENIEELGGPEMINLVRGERLYLVLIDCRTHSLTWQEHATATFFSTVDLLLCRRFADGVQFGGRHFATH